MVDTAFITINNLNIQHSSSSSTNSNEIQTLFNFNHQDGYSTLNSLRITSDFSTEITNGPLISLIGGHTVRIINCTITGFSFGSSSSNILLIGSGGVVKSVSIDSTSISNITVTSDDYAAVLAVLDLESTLQSYNLNLTNTNISNVTHQSCKATTGTLMNINNNDNQGRLDVNIYISNTHFSKIVGGDLQNGAIYLSHFSEGEGLNSFTIVHSSFLNCTVGNFGGAIYFAINVTGTLSISKYEI